LALHQMLTTRGRQLATPLNPLFDDDYWSPTAGIVECSSHSLEQSNHCQ
ncbi:hypothetical protein AVEN_111969-1, partial [Araneus ventricosus]